MTLRRSLFSKYAVYFVALVTIALIASGGIGVYFTYKESKAALLDLQREKAAAAASRIEAYVQEIEHQIGWMRLPQAGASNPEQRRFDYLKLLRQVPAITDVIQLDRSGKERLRVSRLGMDVAGSDDDMSADPKFTVARSGKTYFSPVYFRKETEPYMTIAMAGISEEAGITVAEVNLKFIWDVISRIKIGEKGLAYAVDSQGRLIAHPDISLVLQKSDLSTLPQVKGALTAKPGDDSQRVSIARNPQGHEVLSAYASIQPLNWHVFVDQPIEEAFAPRTTLHGSLADVYGVGLLFVGRSGIGKSECVLDLVERGHRLVADDVVQVTRRGSDILIGQGHELAGHHMEIRGIGLIDIPALFGVRAVRQQKRIEVVVQLEDWESAQDADRTGLAQLETTILEVTIPKVMIPLNPGKNITVISEVIAMMLLLRYSGVDVAAAFNERLIRRMKEKQGVREYLAEDYE